MVGKDENVDLCETVSQGGVDVGAQGGVDVGAQGIVVHLPVCDSECDTVW